MSSPSVQGYTVTKTSKADDSRAEISLKIETAAPHSPSEFYAVTLWLVREGECWRIDRLWTEQRLYPYTLYQP
jgi:hypothetical protein